MLKFGVTQFTMVAALAIGGVWFSTPATVAQTYCTNVGCQPDYLVWNRAGGTEGVASYASGEHTEPYDACGIRFYVSYRTKSRFQEHFVPGGRLERRSDGQTLCRWGNMQ